MINSKIRFTFCLCLCLSNSSLFYNNKRVASLIASKNLAPKNYLQARVTLYRFKPAEFNIKNWYLRFYLPNRVYNFWILFLQNQIGPHPTEINRIKFCNYWTGAARLESRWYSYLWSKIPSQLGNIYQGFDSTFTPQTHLHTLLRNYLTSEEGFAKFYLTFLGDFRDDDFFPQPLGYTTAAFRKQCRQKGCWFQIPIIKNTNGENIYDIGPTINIMPAYDENFYLRNFWKTVAITNHVVIEELWPVFTVEWSQAADPTVHNVIEQILTILKKMLCIRSTSVYNPSLSISAAWYDNEIPHIGDGHLPIVIPFNYYKDSHASVAYQKDLKINLYWDYPML